MTAFATVQGKCPACRRSRHPREGAHPMTDQPCPFCEIIAGRGPR